MSRESWKTRPPGPRDLDHVLARSLRLHRKRAGLTQAELAERVRARGLAWDRATTANLEHGRRRLDIPELLALAAVLGVPVVDLVAPLSLGMDYVEDVGVDVASARELIVGRGGADDADHWPAADELLAAWQREG